jgi:hypothetical protein
MFSVDDVLGVIAHVSPLRGQRARASVGASYEDIGKTIVSDRPSH